MIIEQSHRKKMACCFNNLAEALINKTFLISDIRPGSSSKK